MKHLGDITKINGGEIPVVDVITGGSPCQDLSVAGYRKGLSGERSGLFMEQIRIIKEMRERDRQDGRSDEFIRCRWMVWENVCGALSSNSGEDFRIVLEETARVADPNAVIPRPNGKWETSGCIMGKGYSIAWRVHNACFWGVPQRRRRICLLADFNGASATWILFGGKLVRASVTGHRDKAVRDTGNSAGREVSPVGSGLQGDTSEGGEEGERSSTGTEGSPGAAGGSYTLKIRGGREIDSHGKKAGKGALWQTEKAGTIAASQDQTLIQLR